MKHAKHVILYTISFNPAKFSLFNYLKGLVFIYTLV